MLIPPYFTPSRMFVAFQIVIESIVNEWIIYPVSFKLPSPPADASMDESEF